MAFGENLREALQENGMTMTELANITHIDITNISHIIGNQRKPSLPTLRRILRALPATVDLRELLLHDDE